MDTVTEKEANVQGPDGMKIGAETGTVKPATPVPTTSGASSQPAQGSRINIHPIGSSGHVGSSRTPAGTSTTPSTSAPSQQIQPPSRGPSRLPAAVNEQSVSQVMELGFSREEAVAALQQAGGNVDLAISLLL